MNAKELTRRLNIVKSVLAATARQEETIESVGDAKFLLRELRAFAESLDKDEVELPSWMEDAESPAKTPRRQPRSGAIWLRAPSPALAKVIGRRAGHAGELFTRVKAAAQAHGQFQARPWSITGGGVFTGLLPAGKRIGLFQIRAFVRKHSKRV